jgi:hypothetical protein
VIRIERAALPTGMNAFARRQNGTIVVYVSRGLSVLQRRAAIREALRAAPLAGWRALRSPILLPVLAGSAGLGRAPEGRWVSRALLAAVAVVAAVAISVAAATLLASRAAPHRSSKPPTAVQPGALPTAGPGRSATGSSPRQAAASGPGPTAARSGPTAGRNAKAPAGAPAPETSGKPAAVPAGTASPQPSGQSTSPAPAPAPTSAASPSPSPTATKGHCVDLLGVLVCL